MYRTLLLCGILTLPPQYGAALAEIDAVLRVTPATSDNYVAASCVLEPGQGLSGLRFYNNDQSAAFPRLILMEGTPGQPPDLNDAALILLEVTGESLAWGQVSLPEAVSSSTGMVHFVFELPNFAELSARGPGGGAGLGVGPVGTGLPFHLTANGTDWVAFDAAYELAVEAVLAPQKAAARPLSSLKTAAGATVVSETPPVTRTLLHAPVPNPFNPRTSLSFDLKRESRVTLEVYDLRGRRVRTLLAERWPAGRHRVEWTGVDDRGAKVASGVYLAHFAADRVSSSERMVLLK